MKRALVLLVALWLAACSGATTPTATLPAATSVAPPPTVAAATSPSATPAPLVTNTPGTAGAATSAAAKASPATPAANVPGPPSATATRAGGPTPIPPPNTSPDAASSLITQGVDLVLQHYVDPLDSATLYGVAWQAVGQALTAAGGRASGPAPAFTGDAKGDAALFKQGFISAMQGAPPALNQTATAYDALHAVATNINECHTAFLDPEQYKSVTAGLAGTQSYGGIGVSIRTQSRPVVIGEVFPGTPAASAKLLPGDAILAVDGLDVSNLPADQISPLVRGKEGTPVVLTIQRPGEPAPRDIRIVRARITVPVFTYRVIDGPNGTKIGYMKLYSFSTGAEAQLDKALADFRQQNVTHWVLDLRDNGGGYISTLSAIASRFFKQGPIAYTIVRGGKEEAIPLDSSFKIGAQSPMAVLINAGSASASEAFAAAAQDYGRAQLFGQKTSGCLAGASTFPLADGSAFQITIEKVVSPKRREINRIGVQPDTEVPPATAANTDPTLDAAIAWLVTQR